MTDMVACEPVLPQVVQALPIALAMSLLLWFLVFAAGLESHYFGG